MYYANFSTSNGTSLIKGISDTNLSKLRKAIKKIAASETYPGNRCTIKISESIEVDDERGTTTQEIEYYEARWYGRTLRWVKMG